MTRSFFASLTLLTLALLLTGYTPATAQDKELPPIMRTVPRDVDDLRAIEQHVHAVLEKVMPAVVALQVGKGQGSGVIVSADGLVLTAGHVSQAPGSPALVALADGRKLKAKSLGHDGGRDAGMVKILDGGPFPFVELGDSSSQKPGQWCIAVGHPGGYRVNRGAVVRVGRILINAPIRIQTDCALVGGDSGGPLFDLDGKLIGIHSSIGDRQITENLHVPVDTYRTDWDRLVKGENFGGGPGGPVLVQSAGGKPVLEEKGKLEKKDPSDPKKAGCRHRVFTFKMVPGFAYTIDLRSKEFDSFLRLEDAAGKQLAENDDGAGDLDARIVYRPSREQVYKIIATTCDPNQTGAFTLTVFQAKNDVTDLPGGTIDLVRALRLPTVKVQAVAGVFVNAHLFDKDGRPQANKSATFHWKSGSKTASSDDQGQVRLQLLPDNIQGLELEVPDELRALVRLTDAEGNPLAVKDGGGRRRPR